MRLRPSRKRIILAAAIIIVLFLVVLPAGIAWKSLHPARCDSRETPSDYGLEYTSFTVNTSDGVVLRGWEISPRAGEKSAIVILMHGYTSCKADPRLLRVAGRLSSMGYRVVMFDFRAHGESGGGMTTIGPLEARYDAPAVIRYVEEEHPGRPIVLLGYSMGAVVAIMAGKDEPAVAGIVADSPYPVLEWVIPRWLKSTMGVPEWYSRIIGFWGELFSGVDTRYGPLLLDRVDKPVLVIVGTGDPLITVDEAREIAGKSCCGDTLVVEGAGHIEAAQKAPALYFERLDSFILAAAGGAG